MGDVLKFPMTDSSNDVLGRFYVEKRSQILQCPCGSISFMAYEGGPLQCSECNCFVQEYFCRKVTT